MTDHVDVAIIGGGPAGLAAARTLHDAGVRRVAVFEREHEAGGIPRHCPHPSFGWSEFRRLHRGPTYAARLRDLTRHIDVRPDATVTSLERGGRLCVRYPDGVDEVVAGRILLAVGARETPRAARLISGTRPIGVFTTAQLQQLVQVRGFRPMRRAVVVGSEIVSLSAVMTLRHAGIAVAGLLEEQPRPATWRWAAAYPRMVGVSMRYGVARIEVEGDGRVEGVAYDHQGERERLACDGVIITGHFVPESALIRSSHLDDVASMHAPLVDQAFRTTDPVVSVAGNALGRAETAGRAFSEGRTAATRIVQDLTGDRSTAPEDGVRITWGDGVRLVVPQLIRPDAPAMTGFSAYAGRPVDGRIRVTADRRTVHERRVRSVPGRKIELPAQLLSTPRPLHVELSEV